MVVCCGLAVYALFCNGVWVYAYVCCVYCVIECDLFLSLEVGLFCFVVVEHEVIIFCLCV